MVQRFPRSRETIVGSFIGSVVLHTSDSDRGAEFWRGALGYLANEDNPEFLVPPEWEPPSRTRHDPGAGMHVHLDRGDSNHLDLWVNAGDSLESEVERLKALGATRVDWDYPEGADHVVLADPDGNLFCVVA
jgi:catechol 2,3-dioxygenase-like lactoylglutathione lyase family enzyme